MEQPRLPGAPAGVAEALETLRAALVERAGANLAALVVYGGVARGRYRPGRSDVNVAVVLRDASAERVEEIAGPLRAAWRSVRVEPFILAGDELARAAVVFPTKLLDIQAHHVVLHGDDPFRGIEVPQEYVRQRVEQELRNVALRLRRRLVAIAGDPAAVGAMLAGIARPVAVELAALLRLAGGPPAGEDRTVDIFAAAAQVFDLDGAALSRAASLRSETRPLADLSLCGRVIASITRAADAAGALGPRP